jgi:Tfp pilus assembly protein PilP
MTLTKLLMTFVLVTGCAMAQAPILNHTRASMKGVADVKNAQINEAQQASSGSTKDASVATAAVANGNMKAPAAISSKGPHRDPFVSPIVQKVTASVSCSGGKKCLEPSQIVLKGIVSSDNGKIAVVVNPSNKAYFLREKDPVLNGYVVRITPDSIVFRENVSDRLGKVSTRDVVKKVSAPAV